MNCFCGKPLTAVEAWKSKNGRVGPSTSETLVAFYSPRGHDHDDNCKKRTYLCDDKHMTTVSIRRRCPKAGCDWVGKESCITCRVEKKVENWPSVRIGVLPQGEWVILDENM